MQQVRLRVGAICLLKRSGWTYIRSLYAPFGREDENRAYLIGDKEEQDIGFRCGPSPVRGEAKAIFFGLSGVRVLVIRNDDLGSWRKVLGFDGITLCTR